MNARLLIIGGSYAALNAATGAREAGFDGAVTMVSEELTAPYQRPPLSKAFLKGQVQEADLPLKGDAFYRDQGIDLILGNRVTAIDLHTRRAECARGAALAFDILVLACGARPRRLPSGEDDGVLYLRSLEDARRLKARLDEARSVVILGGGFIGLEAASAAAAMGRSVRLVEGGRRLLARAAPAEISDLLAARHRAAGVDIIPGTAAEARNGRVRLLDGRVLEADLVVAGLGAIPNMELAAAAGLPANDGILADAHGRAGAPDVYAVGDCSSHVNFWAGRRLRLESVQNAVDQARAAGAAIAGRPAPYIAAPRFWSDQYDLKLQMVGLSAGADRDERLPASSGGLSLLHVRDEAVVGVTSLNDPRTQIWARRSLARGPVARAQLAPPGSLAQSAQAPPSGVHVSDNST